MYGIVYLIIDGTNDFEYVGQTRCALGKRFNQHTKNDSYIGNAIRAHGAENFVAIVLKKCASKEELDFWEKHFIKSRDTKYPNGYNLTDGGDGTIGLERTPEHCANISAALTGRKLSPEHCKKISMSHKGIHPTPETIAKRAASMMGEKNPNYGVPMPNKQRAKISAVERGYSPFQNLIAELDANYLSYTAFAELMGSRLSYISRKMLGQRNFSEKDIEKLVKIFGKPAEYLLQREDGKSYIKPPKIRHKVSPFKNLLDELYSLQLSYVAFAKLLGLSHQSISFKMQGKVSFTERDKKKLAEIFDKPIEYLLERNE